jgi:TRAP-type C4-dicarboxylate transport system permease small subunit
LKPASKGGGFFACHLYFAVLERGKTMEFLFNKAKGLSDFTDRIVRWVLIFYVGLNTALIIIMVLFRMMGGGMPWGEELSRWLLVGMAFIGASVALKKGAHVGISIVVSKLPSYIRRGVFLIGNILVLIFLLFFVYYSYQVAMGALRQLGGAIRVPMTVPYLQLPVGGVIMIIHMAYFIFGLFTKNDPDNFALSRLEEGE